MTERHQGGSILNVHPLSEDDKERGLRALQQARQLRQRILSRRGGQPFDSSWELIREMREERACHL